MINYFRNIFWMMDSILAHQRVTEVTNRQIVETLDRVNKTLSDHA